MPRKWLSYSMLTLILVASVAIGCRAPYPTYNPHGFYGNPCVNPPPTGGGYNPTTGRYDPYYGAPNNGVTPANPYVNPYQNYPGYVPPTQPPVTGSTSKRNNWSPTASAPDSSTAEFVSNEKSDDSNGTQQWTTVGADSDRVDVANSKPSLSPGIESNDASRAPVSVASRFDGFGRN